MGGVKCKEFGMVQTPNFLKRNFFKKENFKISRLSMFNPSYFDVFAHIKRKLLFETCLIIANLRACVRAHTCVYICVYA